MVLLQLIRDGGVIMVLIILFSFWATIIFFEKWFQFHREQVNVGELITGLINVLKRDGMVEAITLCDNTPGPVARILMAAIMAYEKGNEDIRQAIEDAALIELPRLEKHMSILATIAYVTPLLGLLGTVIGMQGAFSKISETKGLNLTAGVLAQDINLALMTTAGGLCVAIPCYVAYNYLVTRIESMTIEMEKSASEILYFFKHHKKIEMDNDYAERTVDQDKE